jgi:SAM-dependent MidA family methyltransferase
MGIIERVEQLLDNEDMTDEKAELLFKSVQRIIGDDQEQGPTALGRKFKVIAITNSSLTTPGFDIADDYADELEEEDDTGSED